MKSLKASADLNGYQTNICWKPKKSYGFHRPDSKTRLLNPAMRSRISMENLVLIPFLRKLSKMYQKTSLKGIKQIRSCFTITKHCVFQCGQRCPWPRIKSPQQKTKAQVCLLSAQKLKKTFSFC